MIQFINFYLIPGVVLGCFYALGAIGITLTFSILRFANFAHGEIMTLGVYFTWTLIQLTGQHALLMMPIAMALAALVSLGIDRVFYKPLRASPTIMLVTASFGMMLMLRSLVQFVWGVQLKSLTGGIERPVVLFDTFRVAPRHFYIVALTIALMLAVHFFLSRTRLGKAMRAMSDSPELARLSGIDTEQVIRATWIMGSTLAVAAGVMLAIDTQVETLMGFSMLLPMFASAILGGIGKPYGAVAGGMVIGIAQELSSYPLFGDGPLVSPGYKVGIAFAIMVAMLIWRPQGLFGGRQF